MRLDIADVERLTDPVTFGRGCEYAEQGAVGRVRCPPGAGKLPVGRVRVGAIETLYRKLRRCREHCKGHRLGAGRDALDAACHKGRHVVAR